MNRDVIWMIQGATCCIWRALTLQYTAGHDNIKATMHYVRLRTTKRRISKHLKIKQF